MHFTGNKKDWFLVNTSDFSDNNACFKSIIILLSLFVSHFFIYPFFFTQVDYSTVYKPKITSIQNLEQEKQDGCQVHVIRGILV